MDLEKRVETLEKEVQVLKAQIQASLLDIQDQLLTHAYPALRAENSAPPSGNPAASAMPPITFVSANPGAMPAAPLPAPVADEPGTLSVRKVSLRDLAPSDDDDEETVLEPPRRKERSESRATPARSDRRQSDREESDRRQSDRMRAPEPAQPDSNGHDAPVDTETMARLEEWTMGKVDKYGLARTQQIIQKYADQGRLTAELEARMLRFARLYASSKPQQPPAAQQPPARPASPQNRATQPERPTLPVRPPAPPEPPADAKDDDNAGVVLKLIAGIQNAGAGVRWRKKENG